jgi:NNP family nitrate/nitrite transporter-like MFS transporter
VVLHRARWLKWALPGEPLVVANPIAAVGVQADGGV